MIGPTQATSLYEAQSLTFTIFRFDCKIALVANSSMLASRHVNSIYSMVTAIVITTIVDYAVLQANLKLV